MITLKRNIEKNQLNYVIDQKITMHRGIIYGHYQSNINQKNANLTLFVTFHYAPCQLSLLAAIGEKIIGPSWVVSTRP